ncbi:hypothetical protein OG689_41740 [Kitasatospora sp. NBC_00240]|uniref:hypothetical protein n=1 Tax=Kitasatospora sp. NBC_00240 TaxID=2903567 RepID=UPI0022505074|nr:hypothetical protein [Kitasatospora sp. NBC_00240]MCX5215681.1 hypothetical protein [Kitasatospora sp. NBC_00240]
MTARTAIRLSPMTYTTGSTEDAVYVCTAGTKYKDYGGRTWEMTGVTNDRGEPILFTPGRSKVITLPKLARRGIFHKIGDAPRTRYEYEGSTFHTDRVYIDGVGDPWTHDGTWACKAPGGPAPRYTRPDEPEYALSIPEMIQFHGPLHEAGQPA